MNKRMVSLLLALVMVLGMLPTTAFATEPDTYAANFYGHTAQLNSFKLYTFTDAVKGTTDLLEGVEDSDSSNTQLYTTELAAGDYWLEGYDASGLCSGGIAITVEAKELNEIQPYRAYGIYASNSGWVLGTDYTISAVVSNQDKTMTRQIEMGQGTMNSTVRPSVLCLNGDTVTVTYTPSEARAAENYIETFKTATMTINSSSWSQSIPQAVAVTFQVPNGSNVDAGRFHSYYVYDFAEPVASQKPAEGDWTYTFMVPMSTDWFYRVQNDEGVTYWNYARWTAESTVQVTSDMLYIGSDAFTSNTIYRFDENVYDRADIYLNVNGKGYMDMDVGSSYQLNVFRNWMAIESINNAKVALPDMHYAVIDMEGNDSDILTITPDENNSSVARMTANAEGTAIVLVTYDTMTHMVGMGGSSSKQFSAIWPECTGVFVVTVGEGEADISTNMMSERYTATDTAIDAEHDILFYTGSAGASYTFTPETGCTVTVNRSELTEDSLTFNGFTSEGVTVDENGAVTVSGLTTGRHIVKVEKDGEATYQVLTARGVEYQIQDASGNALAADTEIKAGDTLYLQFSNLLNPAEKLSGAYNFNASIYYVGEDETTFRSNPGSSYGVYDFSGNPVRQKISITIPKYWAEETYTLNGAIMMGGFGNVAVGGHRGITYATGLNPNFNASTVGMILGALPEISFDLAETEFLTGTLSFQDPEGNTIDCADLTVTMSDADGNMVQVAENGIFPCLAGEYSYVVSGSGVEYTTGCVTVTEDGENNFTVTLNTTSDTAWDGSSMSEPAKDENDIYLIGTGAELAWFANAVNSGSTTINAKLTADINLAGYPWTAIGTSSKSFAGTFDGDSHSISKLNVNVTTQYAGLFGYVRNGMVKSVTTSGAVTNTANYTAGIVGYLYYGTVENSVSNVTVTGSNYTGGIAGYTYGGTIRNSANNGAVNGNGYTAGITGTVAGTSSIANSYNTASVTGRTTYVGGILGDASSTAVTVTACYNLGAVSGSNYVGGVIARSTGASATITDCYNAGTVTATGTTVGGFIGSYSNASIARSYYLEGSAASDAAAAVLTAAELKDAELSDESYGKVCNGYPALLWQTDVTFHTKPETGEVTAPNCTVGGYTEYTCTECEESYIYDYVDALGHDWCEDETGCDDCVYTAPTCTEEGSIVRNCRFEGCDEIHTDVIPATGHTEDESQTVAYVYYKECVCSVCGEAYTVYDDARMEFMTIINNPVAVISMSDDGSYPWSYDAENARFESTNAGKNSTTSATSITITLNHSANVSFNYGASSEGNYDKLTISAVINAQTVTIASGISGTTTGTFEQLLEAGTYTLTFSFNKDSSTARNEDLGWFSNLKIEAPHSVSLIERAEEEYLASDATCVDAAEYYKSCETCGEASAETFAHGEANADDHSYAATVVEASCGVEGYTQHTCELCGHNYRDNYVDALEHEYESVVTHPTYETQGYTTHTCSICGDSYVDSYMDPLVRETVSVYLSVSHDDKFIAGDSTGAVMAMKQVDVPYFDLALYGLEEYYFTSENYGSNSGEIGDNTFEGQQPYENKVTMLHLFIYATEVYYYGVNSGNAGKGYLLDEGLIGQAGFNITGNTGSTYFENFWGMDSNLNFYHNFEYPLASSGWGATSDQILLSDGDIVTLAHYSDMSFHSDPISGFNYIKADGESATATAAQGDEVVLNLYRAGADMMGNYTTAQTPIESEIDVYYATQDSINSGDVTAWVKLGTTDESGELVVDTAQLEAGSYVIAVAGRKGETYPDSFCSAPGGILLTVEECTDHEFEEETVDVTCTTDGYTIHTCEKCGYNYRDEYVPAPGHAITDAVTEAAHDTMGYTTHTCTTCGYSYVDSYTDALDHTYVQSVTKEATCTEEGELTFTCECGESYTQVIPVIEHSYTAQVTAPTCRKMGYTTYTCACGESYKGDFVDALDHDLVQTVVAADCLNDGYTMVKCKNCDYSSITAIHEATGHTETVVNVKEATTTSEGYSGDVVCADCGILLEKGDTVAKKDCVCIKYSDVDQNAWYHDAVDYVIEEGLMNGTSATTFAPNATTTRAMLATLLYRIAGEPSVEGVTNPFTDVAEGSWYYDAVVWAADSGVVTGTSAATFAPDSNVSREQMVTMLWRYADQPASDESVLSSYADAASVGSYAAAAMAWAISEGIVNGVTETTLAPHGTATRAQIAAILMRYLEN